MRVSHGSSWTILAVCFVLVVSAAAHPALATEGDMKPAKLQEQAKQDPGGEAKATDEKAKSETAKDEKSEAAEGDDASAEGDVGECDEAGNEVSFNTLEDLMAISRGDLEAIAKLAAQAQAGEPSPGSTDSPVADEVQWREVEPESKGDKTD